METFFVVIPQRGYQGKEYFKVNENICVVEREIFVGKVEMMKNKS